VAAAALAGGVAFVALRALRRRPLDLEGRVALVTGGSRGLGLLLARELGARGACVAICARDEAELGRAEEDLRGRNVGVLCVRCDVTDPDALVSAVEAVRRRWGRLDVLVNNAGVIQVGPLEVMTREDFERALQVNALGFVSGVLAALPVMRACGGGRIVNIGSIGGEVPLPHLLPYVFSKYAAVGLSEGLRVELAKHGIIVTTVIPGLMRTGSIYQARFKGDREAELAWFGAGGSLRLTSMDADRAARRIVAALERGEAYVTLSWQATLVRLAHALAPGLFADVMGLVNRVLPAPDGENPGEERRGLEMRGSRVPPGVTRLADEAAVRNNELGV
jgi:NAD(P)-dependent dehydrogenase (short-subunit alcohol dehydrogenase family)